MSRSGPKLDKFGQRVPILHQESQISDLFR